MFGDAGIAPATDADEVELRYSHSLKATGTGMPMDPALLCLSDTFRRHSYFSAQTTLFGTTPLEHYSRPDRSTHNLLRHPLPRSIRTMPEAQQTPRIPCFT
nr:MAG TPA: hypothetical protein [Caudoviricetes sp.]